MRFSARNYRLTALLFLALILASRVLIPTGWMPSSDGGRFIQMCSGGSMTTAWVDADGKLHKHKPSGQPSNNQPCAFAGIAALAIAEQAALVLIPVKPASQPAIYPTGSAIGMGLAAPPPFATGPPTLT